MLVPSASSEAIGCLAELVKDNAWCLIRSAAWLALRVPFFLIFKICTLLAFVGVFFVFSFSPLTDGARLTNFLCDLFFGRLRKFPIPCFPVFIFTGATSLFPSVQTSRVYATMPCTSFCFGISRTPWSLQLARGTCALLPEWGEPGAGFFPFPGGEGAGNSRSGFLLWLPDATRK